MVIGNAAVCLPCFLEFPPWCFIMPVRLCTLVVASIEDSLECVSELTGGWSVCCCSLDSLADIVAADATGWGRNIPGKTSRSLLGSIKPPLFCCSLCMVSNFCLLMFSESDSSSLSL
ncbi:hypothetical protein CIPAW_14G020300 [Carya illinoinensis]|uniref:Uncharacterized protein n=1 Tax=Carya illinoinensis TaxID=32201 RepID=A0A8T1NFG7_CARIL|nr:hypothetical protein CIPAW_14G020300 [Carya illinoinensis]